MELSVAPDKVQIVKWHPLAKDILCTVAFDKSVKIWDLNKTENGPQLELLVSTDQRQKKLKPNWHELRKQENFSSLAPPKSKFYMTQ